MTCARSPPSLSLSEQEMTPASDEPQALPPGSGPSRTPRTAVTGGPPCLRLPGDGAAPPVRRRLRLGRRRHAQEERPSRPAVAPNRVTSPPPATASLLPAPAPATATAGSQQLPPQPEIPASQSSPPDSTDGNQIARSKPAKRKSPSPSPTATDSSLPLPLEIPASQSPPRNRPDGNHKVRRKKPAKRNSPSPSPPAPATAGTGTGSEQPAPQAEIPASENSPPNGKKKNKTAVAERQCVHCGSKTTPQWRREGRPEGRRTLCNACGVRYRQGRLLPEYRPKVSPTFDKESHASLHSKVLELRRQGKNKQQEQQQPPAPALPQPVHDDSQDVVDLMALPRPVDHLGSELRDGTNSANNAGASSSAMAAGPVGERGWLQLDPFLLDGAAAPMIVEQEGWIVVD